jgi:hypothetical protein
MLKSTISLLAQQAIKIESRNNMKLLVICKSIAKGFNLIMNKRKAKRNKNNIIVFAMMKIKTLS